MYNPVQKGIDRSASAVRYTEAAPPVDLAGFVHRYWAIQSETPQPEDFHFQVLPDACIHIVFNLGAPDAAGITALRTAAEVLDLGCEFHFVGVRLLPGVWQGQRDELVAGVIDAPYSGELPLRGTGAGLAAAADFPEQQAILSGLIRRLGQAGLLIIDPVTTDLLDSIDEIKTVTDMADAVSMSPRQLQRVLKQTTGFAPRDLLKILRLQQSFVHDYRDLYADQAHYIHSFRQITGFTPAKYARKFDV